MKSLGIAAEAPTKGLAAAMLMTCADFIVMANAQWLETTGRRDDGTTGRLRTDVLCRLWKPPRASRHGVHPRSPNWGQPEIRRSGSFISEKEQSEREEAKAHKKQMLFAGSDASPSVRKHTHNGLFPARWCWSVDGFLLPSSFQRLWWRDTGRQQFGQELESAFFTAKTDQNCFSFCYFRLKKTEPEVLSTRALMTDRRYAFNGSVFECILCLKRVWVRQRCACNFIGVGRNAENVFDRGGEKNEQYWNVWWRMAMVIVICPSKRQSNIDVARGEMIISGTRNNFYRQVIPQTLNHQCCQWLWLLLLLLLLLLLSTK